MSSCRESGNHMQFFFSSSKNGIRNNDTIISSDSIFIMRNIFKTPYTIYPSVLKDDAKRKHFLDSISKNNLLTIILLTPFEIKYSFEFYNLNIRVFRMGKNEELKLHSAFVSNLEHYYNPYDFIGKQFSDFDSIKITKRKVFNNIMAGADYDLSGINDTIFIIKTQMTLKEGENTKIINLVDTVIQKTESYKEIPYRVH